jgi:hypothetical protein
MRQHGSLIDSRPTRAPLARLLVGLLVVSVVACADGDAQRQFANDPPATMRLPTMAASPTATSRRVTTATAPVSASPDVLLSAPTAAARIYFRAENDLWTMNVADGRTTRVLAGGDAELRALAPSPTGDQVAVLLVTARDDGETTTLAIVAADGTSIRREGELERLLALPSGNAAEARARSIDWSRVGDQLLVSFAPGGLLAVPLSGPPTPLLGAKQAAAPAGAAWSPSGDAIAFLDPVVAGARTGLYVAPTGATPLDPVPVVASAENRPRSVSEFAWLPDGSGLLFAEADIDNRVATGGDLFQISPSGKEPRLVASAGAAAPVARIARFAPSPAGGAVSYTVVAPGSDGLSFHSLWVQQLGTGARYRLPVPDREAVTDLWWTAEGLVWRTVAVGDAAADSTYAAGPFALYRADSSAPPERLAEIDPAPAASPAASPTDSSTSLPVASLAGSADK